MARHKDVVWALPDEPSLEYAKLGLLMDIRDELQALNRVFQCRNFLAMPQKLDAIVKNTRKKKRIARPKV
jgi:hypothetical protein